VLGLAVAHALFDRYPDFEEGDLAKLRSHVVSRQSCATVARELGLDRLLLERATGASDDELRRLARNRNIRAALVEAVVAAVYLEHGFEAVEDAIVGAFEGRIDYALTTHVDYKTDLQELLARDGRQVAYTVVETKGPPHDRVFTAAALVDGDEAGRGEGRSKKDAEQAAAREVLERLDGGGD
jgi:ribonuclease-3